VRDVRASMTITASEIQEKPLSDGFGPLPVWWDGGRRGTIAKTNRSSERG
jgi:hypothetical protein